MPSHKIHLAIAKKVNEELNLDLDSIMLGSVLPDLTISKNHAMSHYQAKGNYDDELANPTKFIDNYKDKFDNTIMVGYLIHILTDRFFNDYFFKNHCIFNESGKAYKVKLKTEKIKGTIKKYKQSDFAKYDKWLLRHHYVSKFKNFDCVYNVVDLDIAKFDKEYLKQYIKKANNEVDIPSRYKNKSFIFYKVMNKRELDSLFANCINYILNYLKERL